MADLFDIPDGGAVIEFDDGPFAGAEARVRLNVPYRVRREHARLDREWVDAEARSDEEAAAYEGMCALFADAALIDWNLAYRGKAIPATAEGMLDLPQPVAVTLQRTWRRSIGVVVPPLSLSSPSTDEDSTSTDGSSSDGRSDPEPSPSTELVSIP